MKINTFYPSNNGYIIETEDDTYKLDNVTSQMLGFIQESYNENQTEQLVNNILESQYEFNFNPSKARAFNNVKSTSLVLEDAIIEYEPKVSQKVLEQTNHLFERGAIASGLYVLNKVSAPVSFNGKISEQQEIQFKTDCTTLSSRNMLYTTRKLPLANRVLEDEFIYENKGRIYRIPLQYVKEDADEVEVAIREDFNIYVKPTFESLYGHKITRKSDHIMEVETLNHGKYIIESEGVLPQQDETFLAKVTESIGNAKVTKIALTEAEMFTTPGGHPVVVTNVTALNQTTLVVEYYRQAGDAYRQQVQLAPEILNDISIEEYVDTLLPYIARIESQQDFDKSAELSQEVLDVLAEDAIKIYRQQNIGKIKIDKNVLDKREKGMIIIDIDTNPSNSADLDSEPKPGEVVATVADQDGNISKVTYRMTDEALDQMSLEEFLEFYQPRVDKVAAVQIHYEQARKLSEDIFKRLSVDTRRVSSQPDKEDKLVYVEEDADNEIGYITIGDFKLLPPLPQPKVEEGEGTQAADVSTKIDFFKTLILPNFQNISESIEEGPRKLTQEQYKEEFGEADIEVINAGKESQDRVEIVKEDTWYGDLDGMQKVLAEKVIKKIGNKKSDWTDTRIEMEVYEPDMGLNGDELHQVCDYLKTVYRSSMPVTESSVLDKTKLKEEKNKIEDERWSILNEISKGNATYEEYVEQLDNLDARIDEIDKELTKESDE